MKLLNHIIASLLFHILLFSAFITLWPETYKRALAPVFNVNIVEPFKEKTETRETISEIIKKPVMPVRPLTKKLQEKILPPDTMSGEGAGIEPQGKGQEKSTGKTPLEDKGAPFQENKKTLPSVQKPLLFDNEIIEKYARKGHDEEKSLTFDVPEFRHRGYMRMLKDKIESIWRYPKEAAMNRISGDLRIRFSIRRDGSLGDVALIRTSGYRELDEAALNAIKDAEPYWPLPADWEKDELTITGHFIYIIGGGAYMM